MTPQPVILAALLITASTHSLAAPPAQTNVTDTAAAAQTTTLKAVVVTARKKSEALQKVPMSVIALDAIDLRAQAINGIDDIAEVVPGLQQGELAITSRLSLRGVNSGDNNAFEQSVGMYVDGIYRGRMNQQHIGLFDLQRVEVLKGPQVSLYGNSSIGGAISAISRKPSFESSGELRTRYEFEYDETRIDAGFDLPVNDALAFRIAGHWRDQAQGLWFNEYSNTAEPTSDDAAFRLSGLWLASDKLTVALRRERGDYHRDGNSFDAYKHVDGQGQPWPGSYFTGLNNGRLNVGNGAPFKYQRSFLETDMDETVLDLQYQADAFTLTSITGLSSYDYRQSMDVDISPATLINVYQDENYRQFSQELRIAGDASENVDYLAGVYFQNDSFTNDYLSDFNLPVLLAGAFGVPPGLTGQLIDPFSRHILIDQDTRQWAAFGQVNWRFNESWTASLGGRFVRISKEATQAVRTASINHEDGIGDLVDVRWLNPSLGPLLLGNAGYLADPLNYVLTLPDGSQINPILLPQHLVGYNIVSVGAGMPHEFNNLHRREQHPMFQASLAYHYSDDLMFYGNWGNGAKAGGFDFLYEGNDRDAVDYAPEKANVFEVGLKKDWQNLRLNLATFYGQYDDLQVSVFDGGIGFVVGNAASSISRGVDVEVLWAINKHWQLSGNATYLDFYYDDFRTANCSTTERLTTGQTICDWSGRRTPFVPNLESAVAVENSGQLFAGWGFRQTLDWRYKGSHSTASDNEIQTRQAAYHLIDYRIELTPEGRDWSIGLSAKNLTNRTYNVFTSVIPLAPGGAFANVRGKGREWAMEWRYKF